MKAKAAMICLTLILSITLLFVVNLFLYPAANMGRESASYVPWILRFNFMNYPNLHANGIVLSGVLLVGMAVVARRTYGSRMERLLHIAIPLLIALVVQFLLVNEIDTFILRHKSSQFANDLVSNLPYFFTTYMFTGLLIYLGILITCYPIGILVDKLLLYITSKTPKHRHG